MVQIFRLLNSKSQFLHLILVLLKIAYVETFTLNPLIANPTKWSNTLKQFGGKSQRIV